jgi:GNAT superfamily N-acetyltransferase
VEDVQYWWRNDTGDDEIRDLVLGAGGSHAAGWWDTVRPHSLGWVTARDSGGRLVAFANVAWDGHAHAFLLDPTTHVSYQRLGIGTAVVELAARETARAGCEWLHVDFEAHLRRFHFDACGFMATDAGLIHLPGLRG